MSAFGSHVQVMDPRCVVGRTPLKLLVIVKEVQFLRTRPERPERPERCKAGKPMKASKNCRHSTRGISWNFNNIYVSLVMSFYICIEIRENIGSLPAPSNCAPYPNVSANISGDITEKQHILRFEAVFSMLGNLTSILQRPCSRMLPVSTTLTRLGVTPITMCTCIYIYIEREREENECVCMYIYIHVCVCVCLCIGQN